MTIQSDLREFYDAQAEKYYQTRNKHRADADIFLDAIKTSDKKTIKILEFGCGSGRLLAHLKNLPGKKIQYTGVDISKNLLSFSKKQISGKSATPHIKADFVCDDIVHYVQSLKQESFDIVVGAASFQHIPTNKERFILIKNIYRILKYDGQLLMTNRSFSQRFIKKYQTSILAAIGKYIISFGKNKRNDLMIPWNHQGNSSKRFYHIYTLAELKNLVSMSGFIIEQLGYLDKGTLTPSRKHSQNSLVIAKKIVFLKND